MAGTGTAHLRARHDTLLRVEELTVEFPAGHGTKVRAVSGISLDVVEGDLATLPGFDPGRALTRPSGEFLLLKDIRLSVGARPEAGVAVGDHALINRYKRHYRRA